MRPQGRYRVGFLGHPRKRHVVEKPSGEMLRWADGGFVACMFESQAQGIVDGLNLGEWPLDKHGRLLPHPTLRHARAQRLCVERGAG